MESQTVCITYQGLLSPVLIACILPISYFMIFITFIFFFYLNYFLNKCLHNIKF